MTDHEPSFRLIILLPRDKWEEAFAESLEEARAMAERIMLQGHWKVTGEGMELIPPTAIQLIRVSSIPAPTRPPLLRSVKGSYL